MNKPKSLQELLRLSLSGRVSDAKMNGAIEDIIFNMEQKGFVPCVSSENYNKLKEAFEELIANGRILIHRSAWDSHVKFWYDKAGLTTAKDKEE